MPGNFGKAKSASRLSSRLIKQFILSPLTDTQVTFVFGFFAALYSGAPVQDFAPGLATADFVKSLTGTPPAANPSVSLNPDRLRLRFCDYSAAI